MNFSKNFLGNYWCRYVQLKTITVHQLIRRRLKVFKILLLLRWKQLENIGKLKKKSCNKQHFAMWFKCTQIFSFFCEFFVNSCFSGNFLEFFSIFFAVLGNILRNFSDKESFGTYLNKYNRNSFGNCVENIYSSQLGIFKLLISKPLRSFLGHRFLRISEAFSKGDAAVLL